MNISGILRGGLVAGAIIIASAMLMVLVVGKEMDLVLSRFNLPPMGIGAMVFFAFVSVSMGMLLVLAYAAVLPRLGPGPKTATIVALVAWFYCYFLANVSLVAYGFMPVGLTVIGTAWGLVELVLAALVGTRFYKEPART
jgi:hypothetical protein